MTTDALTRTARTNLSAGQTLLMDGAPADALRCALQACEALFILVCRRYIPLASDVDMGAAIAKKKRT